MVTDDARAALCGAWRLVPFEDRPDVDSSWVSYGTDPRGLIIYDPSGVISVHLVSEGPVPSAKGYIGYWGTYRVTHAEREEGGFRGTLEHSMEGGSTPELFDEGPERPFELNGDRLVLGDGRRRDACWSGSR